MSRLASLLIVLLAIAVATPVLAEERLSLSGAMRVRGFHVDIDSQDSTSTFANQRLRIGGKLSIAEGVSVSFRTDITESTWGSQAGGARVGFAGGNARVDNIHFDRAHLDLQNDMFHLRAGQQFYGFGLTGVDNQSTGLLLNIKGAVPVTIIGALDDNNGTSSDGFTYGVSVGHKTDAYAADIFAASSVKRTNMDEEVYMLGLTYAQNFEALKIFTEIEYFTGDATATVDAYGLQAVVDVSTAVSETVTIGGQFFYAMGDDEDAQYYVLGNEFNTWDGLFDLSTGGNLTASSITGGNPYVVLGSGAGLYGGRVYVDMKASDQVMVSASGFYGVADEDDVALYENAMALAAGLKYNFMPKTYINFQVQYTDKSKELAADDLEKLDVGTALVVNF